MRRENDLLLRKINDTSSTDKKLPAMLKKLENGFQKIRDDVKKNGSLMEKLPFSELEELEDKHNLSTPQSKNSMSSDGRSNDGSNMTPY